ncbi:MAG TPA: cytochrome c3 family protein [Candidatus Hydrogenedentes bacterium]|nr:cytochrome c3 family protein [Candidatus Hydrogenedentota bacterium]
MSKETATYVLAIGLVLSLLALTGAARTFNLAGNHQGYEPPQPIAFSHRLHAGELGMDCLYCHAGAQKSRHGGVPAASVCMNCHEFVTATLGAVQAEEAAAKEAGRAVEPVVSPEIAKLYEALGLNEKRERDPAKPTRPIAWTRIHNLPDFVYFDHRAHVGAGVSCQQCHGNVETMERVRQVETLAMGWCVNCHRQANAVGVQGRAVNASLHCTTCHY